MIKSKHALTMFTIIILFLLFLVGCSSQKNESSNQAVEVEPAMKLNAFLNEVYSNADTAGAASNLSQQLYSMTTYQLLNDATDFYEVEITYPNLGEYLFSGNLDSIDFTSEESKGSILAVLENGDVEMVTEIIKIELVDGEPEINDALTNAFCGGLLSALTDAVDHKMMEFIGEAANE